MGGDHAPRVAVMGAYEAAVEDGASILLVGPPDVVAAELRRCGAASPRIEVVAADEVVGMDESAIAVRTKRRSSLRLCAQLVKEGRAQAMVTAGNTGAAMVAAKVVIGTVPGVDRPALAAVLPNRRGRTVLLDVGANVDTRPEHLVEFAVMGHFYAQEVLGTAAPRVGLMSVGEEAIKGTETTREVFRTLSGSGLNFVGNVEGRDVFNGECDVVVCDGFVGNVLLKSAESMGSFVGGVLREGLSASFRTKLGYLLARPAFDRLRRLTDPNEYGAAPLLGVDGGCFIAHGRSTAKGIRSSIRRAVEFCEARLHVRIREKMAELHATPQAATR